VCEILGLVDKDKQIRRLDDDEKQKVMINPTPSWGNPNRWIINEAGLYSLILRSDKPGALEFKRWITHEVLPQIRKTGGIIPRRTYTCCFLIACSIFKFKGYNWSTTLC
jgi:anti-repressor protein